MTSILEAILKIAPIIEATLDTYNKNPQLYPLQNATHDMQLTTYWLKAAEDELKLLEPKEDTLSQEGGTPFKSPLGKLPTLLGTPEYFEFIMSHLFKLHKEVQEYTDNTFLPPTVAHKVTKGNDRIMEALFNTQLANQYYGQLTGK